MQSQQVCVPVVECVCVREFLASLDSNRSLLFGDN